MSLFGKNYKERVIDVFSKKNIKVVAISRIKKMPKKAFYIILGIGPKSGELFKYKVLYLKGKEMEVVYVILPVLFGFSLSLLLFEEGSEEMKVVGFDDLK